MRTTVSIDDDVLTAVRERAARERRTIGDVLSDLARQALIGTSLTSSRNAATHEFLGFDPFPHRGEVVSNALIDRLREDEAT